MNSQPECSIIIVNWNVKDLLIKTIGTVIAQTNVNKEIIIIDNGSIDGSVKALKEHFDDKIVIIPSQENLGFARANNLAVKQSKGEYLLFLNPDCYLEDNSLATALSASKHNKDAIVGFRLFNDDASQQLSIRKLPRLKDIFLFCLRFNHWPKLYSLFSDYFQLKFNYNISQPVEQVMGACFLVKKSLFEQLGGFDEKFFIWLEEVDLCKRTLGLNKLIYYEKNARATHIGGQSFNQVSGCEKNKIFFSSLFYYSKKHFSLFYQPFIYLATKISIILGCLFSLWKK
jgi:GT2 family glycosyltransferase